MPLIIIVDDNPGDMTLIDQAIALRCPENRTESFESGETALARLSMAPKPDLVILDWNMPGMNGGQILTAIRENKMTSELPVAIFTSSTRQEEISVAKSLGIQGWYRKPLDLSSYFQVVSRIARLSEYEDGVWASLLATAASPRPHTRLDWLRHRAVFSDWLNLPLREQANEIRCYLSEHDGCPAFSREKWQFLVPASESREAEELFLNDLQSLFRVLAAAPSRKPSSHSIPKPCSDSI